MSREQLDRAYTLIKDGQLQEAISIIEAVIRADRENENAWWLLANATNDPAAKQNALNNVIRLTENTDRANKAKGMLQTLDQDPYDFDDKPKMSGNMSSYQAKQAPPRRSGMGGCGKVAIGVIAVFGICACISILGVYWAARPIFDAIGVPDSYESFGLIEGTFSNTDSISPDNEVDGFLYRGTASDSVLITVDSKSDYSPFIFVYDMNNGILVDLGQASTPGASAQLNFSLPSSGEYLIAVRGFELFGQPLGFGDYDIHIEVRG